MTSIKIARVALAFGAVACVSAPASAQTCGDTTWDLTAGQFTDVGSVMVSNDLSNVYVTYTLDYDGSADCPDGAVVAQFGTLHAWVGDNLLNLPAVPSGPNAGTPIPGQFPYAQDVTGLQTYKFTIPFADLGITNAVDACKKPIFVVTHAEVNYLDCDGNLTGGGDTAFGGDDPVNVDSPGRWWFWGEYSVCCDFGPPPVASCETAFAKGGWVWTTMSRANPEGLPSLELNPARWGWAINLTEPGTTQYDIWAGAGRNDVGNGVLVGTLTISWDGTNVMFCVDLVERNRIDELHVYAGDEPPMTIAPGQYGYLRDFNELVVQSWCDALPAADGDEDGVWVVVHAVVCSEDTPPCDCDWDGDGRIDIIDLLDYLKVAFDDGPPGDCNGSGTTDGDDLQAFLNCWFAATN